MLLSRGKATASLHYGKASVLVPLDSLRTQRFKVVPFSQALGFPSRFLLGHNHQCGLLWWLKWWRIQLQWRRPRFSPWVGRILCRRECFSRQYSSHGEAHGLRSLALNPWGCKESDTTEGLSTVTSEALLVSKGFCRRESESHSVTSDSLWPHRLHSPCNSLGQNTGVGNLSLLQGIFPTQGSNPGLPHCRQILN